MDFTTWLRGILVVALLGWLLEALQPASELRRYTRLAIGLLVMVAVMRPLIPMLESLPHTLSDPFLKFQDVGSVMQQGVFLNRQEEGLALVRYRTELVQAARAAAETVPGVRSASAEVQVAPDNAPRAASIAVQSETQTAALTAGVQQAVAAALGISAQSVRVDFGKGGG